MTPPPPPSPPIPKPRFHYTKNSRSSTSSLDRDGTDENLLLGLSNGLHLGTDKDAPPLSAPDGLNEDVFPTLASITDIISTNIPLLAGIAAAIGDPAPSAPSAPLAPPSLDSLADSISTNIPGLAEAANAVINPAALNSSLSTPSPATVSGVPTLDIFSFMANIPSLAGTDNSVTNTTGSSIPSAPPLTPGEPRLLPLRRLCSGDTPTDVGALSQLVTRSLDAAAGVQLPPGESTEEALASSPGLPEETSPYVTVLASWISQEADTESSNEEEDTGLSSAFSGSDRPEEGVSGSDPATTRVSANHSRPLIPARPPPPPPHKKSQSVKQKTPRAATIRVSRKKLSGGGSALQSAVVRASWLDFWKGFRHSVLWATLDGQLMSLRKKRSDRFSEVLFHVSSITNVKPQDKGRFSVYFRKKHYDFMAHSDEVQEGWLTSLLATRGLKSPAPPELHGQVTIKDSWNRAYAAVWGHNLWIYPNKDSFLLGIASFSIPLSVATVKSKGKQSFTLITPYKTFNLSVDSSKDLSIWMDSLSSTIKSALSCSQLALRLWENAYNKVCGDCGAPNPEWASVNLLMVICHNCAGQHRGLGSNLSKVRSLRMDNKAWTEPLIQLFVTYGNRLANQVWAPAVPTTEQLRPESTDEERSKFIQDKYGRGRYRRLHALTSSRTMMNQRLCQVVVSDDVEETMSLICSGAKVCPSDPQSPSPILLAEKANQALQIELLRLNEYTEVPPHQPHSDKRRLDSTPSAEEEEELHGKLEEDRFLFSVENDSAACDVLDLREVLSVFLIEGPNHQFQLVTLSNQLNCDADDKETLQTHLLYILKVILPGVVSFAEVGGAIAVSKVVEVGGALNQSDAWLLLWEDGVSIHPVNRNAQSFCFELSALSHHEMNSSENIITIATADRSVSLRFEEQLSCDTWFKYLQRALANQSSAPECPPAANHSSILYPTIDAELRGSVPPAIERCIAHITTYGLKVEGVYRRCGLATKVKQLVEALMTSPNSAPLENDEQGVLDAGSALKQFIRDKQSLIPNTDRLQWQQAAVISDERRRFKEYRRLLRQLPDDNRATLNALFGHFYMIQVFSQVNKMSAHNLAVVLVPSLFQAMSQDLIGLMKEFIIHHTLLFLTPDGEQREKEEEEITVL
ncbi:arf-GAP with Rho-GAP domain, ANK repeat and PH domain-containing protein 1 [Kryptolebias marmoratus]|uniref:arf-GAP with Rho-GAP domain, ANK repeat and PH domain-containing protein 1 n=1 Tax=Kryptolebias marmoratus TaxID=37003 RepID=UPI0018ACF1A4|nr:arf-GAP with Rho-GAP domain, ANK repeat and PH domain-containing protein 1 [Kryptolebias marmoratus]XP_037830411.1 arf-GAP with Rho-GAP domain, ANK repeat and PH domain-containing protein 1 [Kryptolebias marmoratus]